MNSSTYTEHWIRYWEHKHETSARFAVEKAARAPTTHWLTADVPVLIDEDVDLSLADIHEQPDEVLTAARTGFAEFVERADIDGAADDGYAYLSVHLAGVSHVNRDSRFSLDDAVSAANTLSYLRTARVTERPETIVRPFETTYRCPAEHETVVSHPLYRTDTVERCGTVDCSNDVIVDDGRTRVRRVSTFTVEHDGWELPCVATGRYTSPDFDRFHSADQLHLTGVLRFLEKEGGVDPVYEVLHADMV